MRKIARICFVKVAVRADNSTTATTAGKNGDDKGQKAHHQTEEKVK